MCFYFQEQQPAERNCDPFCDQHFDRGGSWSDVVGYDGVCDGIAAFLSKTNPL